jgi:hypothetical protein
MVYAKNVFFAITKELVDEEACQNTLELCIRILYGIPGNKSILVPNSL